MRRAATSDLTAELTSTGTAVAAFDLDGTLTRRGSVMAFLRHVRGLPTTSRAVVRELPTLAKGVVKPAASAHEAKEALFLRLLEGLPQEEVAASASEFVDSRLAPRLREDTAKRLAWHQRLGHRVVIVSASPEIYVAPFGERLNVDAVLATRLEVGQDGRLTGRIEGQNCRGPEKLARLLDWIGASAPERLWAYGDSGGDAELLDHADIAVRVGRRALTDLPDRTVVRSGEQAPQ